MMDGRQGHNSAKVQIRTDFKSRAAAAPPALVSKLFAAKKGDVVTASDESGAFVAELKEIQIQENPADADINSLSDRLAGEARSDVGPI